MDEAGRKAARRRAMISFVAAGVLVVVSVVGLIAVDRRHGRFDRPGLDRIEHRMGEMGPGEWGPDRSDGQDGDADGPRSGGQDSRPAFPDAPERGPRTQDGGRPGGQDRSGGDDRQDGEDGSTTTSTTTTAPSAGGI